MVIYFRSSINTNCSLELKKLLWFQINSKIRKIAKLIKKTFGNSVYPQLYFFAMYDFYIDGFNRNYRFDFSHFKSWFCILLIIKEFWQLDLWLAFCKWKETSKHVSVSNEITTLISFFRRYKIIIKWMTEFNTQKVELQL